MYFKDQGIILNSYESTGADRIVEILLKNRGRLSVVFKGIRKSKSTKLNSADMGNYVEIFVYRKNPEQLPYIREIKVKNHFTNIKKDHIKFIYLNYISELFLNFAHPGEANLKLYNFLLKTLSSLQRIKKNRLELFVVYIQFRLIQLSGIMPDFRTCIQCHKEKPVRYFFVYNELICEACKKEEMENSTQIDKKFLKSIEKINKHSIIKIESLEIDRQYIIILDKIFKNIIHKYLNKELKSFKILKKMLEIID